MTCRLYLIPAPFVVFACLASTILAQSSAPQSKSQTAEKPEALSSPFLLREHTRMVNVDVVVEDSKGNHIHGLTPGDFEIYEETPSTGGKKRVQKIDSLREIETAAMNPPAEAPTNLPPGVYSNAVAVQKDPVPPTVLLVDGLNTEVQYQAQVHRQMLRMLKQIPRNVPVAVFLMGYRLTLLQGFTTDPQLLQEALGVAESPAAQGLAHIDPTHDPAASGNQMYGLEGTGAGGDAAVMIARAQEFDQIVYAAELVQRTDASFRALLSLARSLEGYPGRKNILWLSTSFPLTFNWFKQTYNDAATVNNWAQMKILNHTLSAANVAVYPVDVGGVRTLDTFSAGTRPANPFASGDTSVDGRRVAASQGAEMDMMNNELDTMQSIAEDTGGKVCTGSNDLGKCIHDAMRDSSAFYEISYVPDSKDWNGEYRKVIVKMKGHGARLSYRHGYYATDEANPDQKFQETQLQKDCNVVLNATGIAFTARKLAPDAKGQLGLSLDIDSPALTLTPSLDGQQKMDVEVAVCTFDKEGRSQDLLTYPLHLSLDDKAYSALINGGGKVSDSIFVPGATPAAVRVIVKDVPSGCVGSVYIPTGQAKQGSADAAHVQAPPR